MTTSTATARTPIAYRLVRNFATTTATHVVVTEQWYDVVATTDGRVETPSGTPEAFEAYPIHEVDEDAATDELHRYGFEPVGSWSTNAAGQLVVEVDLIDPTP